MKNRKQFLTLCFALGLSNSDILRLVEPLKFLSEGDMDEKLGKMNQILEKAKSHTDAIRVLTESGYL